MGRAVWSVSADVRRGAVPGGPTVAWFRRRIFQSVATCICDGNGPAIRDGQVRQECGCRWVARRGPRVLRRWRLARVSVRADALQRSLRLADIRVSRRFCDCRVGSAQGRVGFQAEYGAHRGGVLRDATGRDHGGKLWPVRRLAGHGRRKRQCLHVGSEHSQLSQ